MNSFPRLLPLLALASFTAARAQDITASVTQSPGLATYGISVQGPPNGLCLPACSLLLNPPLLFPGVLGALQIDPLYLIGLSPLPLDGTGLGVLQLPVPLAIANGLPVMMQGAVIDPAHNNQIAFTDFGAACPVFQPANPNLPAVILNCAVNNGNVTVDFATGPAGGNVTILVNGGQKAQGYFTLGPGGQGSTTMPVPGGIQRGDTVTVLVNGVPVTSHRY